MLMEEEGVRILERVDSSSCLIIESIDVVSFENGFPSKTFWT